jgi:hypothetical protein
MVGNRLGIYTGHHAGLIVFNNKIVLNNLPCEERPKLTRNKKEELT